MDVDQFGSPSSICYRNFSHYKPSSLANQWHPWSERSSMLVTIDDLYPLTLVNKVGAHEPHFLSLSHFWVCVPFGMSEAHYPWKKVWLGSNGVWVLAMCKLAKVRVIIHEIFYCLSYNRINVVTWGCANKPCYQRGEWSGVCARQIHESLSKSLYCWICTWSCLETYIYGNNNKHF